MNLKRMLISLAILSMINLAALIAGAAYAGKQGWFKRDRLREALMALNGAKRETPTPTTLPAEEAPATEAPPGERIRRSTDTEQIARTDLDRRVREIQDGWAMLERQQIALVQARESFEAQKKEYEEVLARRAAAAGDDGLKRELEILSGVKAKEAKELLKQKKEADVVRILMTMEERKARKIVSECKTDEERSWIGRILEKLHDRNAVQAEALVAGK
jgi:hypothetical protein